MTIRSSTEMVAAALAEITTLEPAEALLQMGRADVLFVDIREAVEIEREGSVPGAFFAPRGVLEFWVDPASAWHKTVFSAPGVRLLLYCAVGWRSALAAKALQDMGVPGVSHLGGGLAAWKAAGGPIEPPPSKTPAAP